MIHKKRGKSACHTFHLPLYYFSHFDNSLKKKGWSLCLSAYRLDKNRFGKNKGFGKRYENDYDCLINIYLFISSSIHMVLQQTYVYRIYRRKIKDRLWYKIIYSLSVLLTRPLLQTYLCSYHEKYSNFSIVPIIQNVKLSFIIIIPFSGIDVHKEFKPITALSHGVAKELEATYSKIFSFEDLCSSVYTM